MIPTLMRSFAPITRVADSATAAPWKNVRREMVLIVASMIDQYTMMPAGRRDEIIVPPLQMDDSFPFICEIERKCQCGHGELKRFLRAIGVRIVRINGPVEVGRAIPGQGPAAMPDGSAQIGGRER